jgi:hypothetical protein
MGVQEYRLPENGRCLAGPRSSNTVLPAYPTPIATSVGFTLHAGQHWGGCAPDSVLLCEVRVVSSAKYFHSGGGAGKSAGRARSVWRRSSLSTGNGKCVEVETVDLRGERRLEEVAHHPGLELVRMALGSQGGRSRAPRLLSLLLAAGLTVTMIVWACHAIIAGLRLRASQFAIQTT